MIVQGRSSKSSSSRYRKSKSSSSNNNRYAVSKSGMKVAPGSAAYDRVVSNGGAVVTLDNGDGGYVRKNRDGTTTSYNSGYSTGSRRSSGGGGGAYRSYLEDARRSAMDAQRARVQSAIDSVAAQQAGINSTADKNAQQAYIAKEQALTNMPQQLASLGQSGGASESALLGLNTGYENNRNSIFENRDKAIQQNQQQQNQIRASGDASIADIENAYASKLAQFEAEQEQYERQRRDQLNDIQSQRDYDQSVWERNNAYAAKLAAQKAAQGGGTSYSKPSLTPSQALSAYENGYDSPEIRAAVQRGYGDIFDGNSQNYPSNGIPATVSRTGNYNDAWVQSIIKTYRNMGLSDYEIAQKLNSMGYN